jgi:hypothetical protein
VDLFTPVYLTPLVSVSVGVLALIVAALSIAAAVLLVQHRRHDVWRHR